MKRISSKVKQKQIETKMLQQQTKKMEEKLLDLKKQVEQQKRMKSQQNIESTASRWRKSTNSNAPLKDYAKKILQQQTQAFKKYGFNPKQITTNSKSFNTVLTKIRDEHQQIQSKDTRKIPKLIEFQKQQIQTPIQNNFWKAKIDVDKLVQQKTLHSFLQENYLLQYMKIFQSAGIENLDDLYRMSKKDIESLGIKPGHQIKIMKKIKQQFEEKKQKQPIVQTKKQLVSFGYGDNKLGFNGYQAQDQQNKEQSSRQQNVEEQDNHQNQFLGKQANAQEYQEYDQEEYDNVEFLTIPMMSQICIQSDQKQMKEQFCYQCYKKILNGTLLNQKWFCGEKCISSYLKQMERKCPQCQKIFIKSEGIFENGLWFCSIGCCPNRNEIEEMFIKWTRKQK